MPDIEHSTLSGSELHEPKGISGASNGEAYVADGVGGGAWEALVYTLTGVIDDVSTADTVRVAVPFGGSVSKVVTVLEGAITSADATLTVRDAAASSMGTITVTQSGSAAGDVDTLVPASNNAVSADTSISIETDGGSSTAQKVWFTIVVEKD